MKSQSLSEITNPTVLPLLGIIGAVSFWMLDSIADVYFFEEGSVLIENILSPAPDELWMRGFVVVMMLAMSFYARTILNIQIIALKQLAQQNEKLNASEQRFIRIAQAAPIGIFQTDIAGKYIFINEGYQKIAKIKESDALGDGWSNFIYPDDKKMVFDEWALSVKENRPFAMDYRQLMTDDKFIWIHCRSQAEYGDKGKILSYLGTIQDITEQKALNERINRTQKMDALGNLTGGIAHDFNNLLGIILGYSELLAQKLSGYPELKKYAHEITHAGTRGAKLTKKLLSFSYKKNVANEITNINTMLLSQQHMLEKILTARIQLKYHLTNDVWVSYLDSSDFEDAIVNLCINAMHSIENSGDLTINTSNVKLNASASGRLGLKSGDYIALSITDTGCGIDKVNQEKVFEPFFTTKGDKGSGLGLSQVYGFIERSNGAINIDSEINKGTCFTLYFPRYYESENHSLDDNIHPVLVDNGNETILVVDDEAELLELIREILTQQGYSIICANNGKEALEILNKKSIDLLFSDVIMPGMSGYQLAHIVKEKFPDVKIQLSSGFSDEENLDDVDEILRQTMLSKPFDFYSLQRAIRDTLERN